MSAKKERKRVNSCYDCQTPLELFEFDMQRNRRIMKCKSCGLFHFYKRNLLGTWKLLKVSKNFDPLETRK